MGLLSETPHARWGASTSGLHWVLITHLLCPKHCSRHDRGWEWGDIQGQVLAFEDP